jgi:hypothetical protein
MTRRRVLLTAAAVLVALVFVELSLRMTAPLLFNDASEIPDADLGWALRPSFGGWETEENTLWIETNSAGFRDRERSVARTPGTTRLALIGDSYVHGFYLPLEQTLGASLERALAQCRTSSPVEVLNFGVQGYSTAQELLLYRLKVAAYRPDIVMLAFFSLNDITGNHKELSAEPAPYFVLDGDALRLDNSFRDRLPAASQWPLRRQAFEWLQLHSRVAVLLNDRVSRLQPELFERPDRTPVLSFEEIDRLIYRPPSEPSTVEAWRITEALLLEFAKDVKAAGSEFWIVTLANNEQVDPDLAKREAFKTSLGVDDLYYPDRRIADFGRANGIPVITLAPLLAEHTARTGEYLNGGKNIPLGEGHWNETGTRVASEYTSRELCARSPVLSSAAGTR